MFSTPKRNRAPGPPVEDPTTPKTPTTPPVQKGGIHSRSRPTSTKIAPNVLVTPPQAQTAVNLDPDETTNSFITPPKRVPARSNRRLDSPDQNRQPQPVQAGDHAGLDLDPTKGDQFHEADLQIRKQQSPATRLAYLRIKLKTWEQAFLSSHGRKAGKDDIKKDVKIAARYREYHRIRQLAGTQPDLDFGLSQTRPERTERTDGVSDRNLGFSTPDAKSKLRASHSLQVPNTRNDDADTLKTPQTQRVLFVDPTPQRNGHVLGLFDHLSPSKGSPTKRRLLPGRPPLSTIVSPSKLNPNYVALVENESETATPKRRRDDEQDEDEDCYTGRAKRFQRTPAKDRMERLGGWMAMSTPTSRSQSRLSLSFDTAAEDDIASALVAATPTFDPSTIDVEGGGSRKGTPGRIVFSTALSVDGDRFDDVVEDSLLAIEQDDDLPEALRQVVRSTSKSRSAVPPLSRPAAPGSSASKPAVKKARLFGGPGRSFSQIVQRIQQSDRQKQAEQDRLEQEAQERALDEAFEDDIGDGDDPDRYAAEEELLREMEMGDLAPGPDEVPPRTDESPTRPSNLLSPPVETTISDTAELFLATQTPHDRFDDNDEVDVDDDPGVGPRWKKKGQKRTTRHVRMKPAVRTEPIDRPGRSGDGAADGQDEDDGPSASTRKHNPNAVSNLNYRRLKIKDRGAKRGNFRGRFRR